MAGNTLMESSELANQQLRQKQPITQKMAAACYTIAKSIFPNTEKINEAANEVSNETGINLGSAKDYIKNFFLMMKGEKLSHDMKESDSRFYFENIQKDYGDEALRKALNSLQLYIAFSKQNHPGLQKLLNEFYEKINN